MPLVRQLGDGLSLDVRFRLDENEENEGDNPTLLNFALGQAS